MFKKIIFFLIIVIFVLVLWVFRGFLESVLFKTEKSVVKKSIPEEIIVEEEIKKTIEKNIIGIGNIKAATKINENKIIYYNQNNFIETDLVGSYKKNLGSYPYNNPKTIKCSKTGKFCIVWSEEKFSIFNLEFKKNTELTGGIKAVNFNSLEDGLIYLFFKDGNYELNSSDLDGNNWIQLKKIKGKNVSISVSPRDDKIIYFSKKVSATESGIFLTEILKQEPAQKIVEKDIIDVLWSPTGTKILFSFYDHSVTPKRVQLGCYDLNQNQEYELGLPSIAQKCAWSKTANYLYCAVLTSTSPKVFEIDDWYLGKFISQDIFWKIDLNESKKEKIFNDLKKYPQVDSFNSILLEDELFFIDKISGNLIKREI